MRKIFHPGIFLDTDKERVYVIEVPPLNGKDYAEIMFMGDIHIGHRDFAPRFLAKYLSFLAKNKERRVILMGDYFEHEEGTSFIKEQILDFRQQVAEFIKFFQPVAKQVIAMVYGNHDERYCKATAQGVDLLDYLRLKMGNPNIAIAPPQRGLVIVVLVKKSFGEGYFAYPIYVLHSSTGSIVNLETQFRRTADNFDVGLIAHGHSLTGNRFIVVRNSKKEVKVIQLKDFEKIFNTDTWETPTLDKKNGYPIWRKVYNCWSTPSKEPIFRITTPCGITEVTGKHGIFVLEKGKKILKDAAELKIGDYLIHQKEIPIDYFDYHLEEDLAWLLGFFCAEGSLSKYSINLVNKNKSLLEKSSKIMQRHFPNTTQKLFKRKDGYFQINLSSKDVSNYFRKNCLDAEGKKKVPEIVLNSPNRVVKKFLEGYYSGDGESGNLWRIKTIDEPLLNGLCFLTHRLPESKERRTAFHFDAKKKAWTMSWTSNRNTKHLIKTSKHFYASPIIRIEKINSVRKVYDLEVEKDERFLDAQGMILVHNTHKIFWKENTKFIVMEDESGEFRRAVIRQYWLSTGSFLRFPSYGETKSYPIPDMGAPIVRFYSSRHALEYVDPRTTYGLDQEPFAETYEGTPQSLEMKSLEAKEGETKEIKQLICPECGSYRIGSKGTEWICKVCGKRWVKNPRRKMEGEKDDKRENTRLDSST